MFDPTTYTGFHTWLSLIALATGIVVVIGMFSGKTMPIWSAVFLGTSVGTSATGLGFPFNGFLPSHAVAIIALVVLAVTFLARYGKHLMGSWRWIYVAGSVASLYFLVFVGIAQAFGKVPALHALAPTQAEPPFAISQGVTLLLFVIIGVTASRTFRRNTVFA